MSVTGTNGRDRGSATALEWQMYSGTCKGEGWVLRDKGATKRLCLIGMYYVLCIPVPPGLHCLPFSYIPATQ